MDPVEEFLEALADPADQPLRCFEALHRLAGLTVGVRLFTLLRTDLDAGEGCRIYSSMPDVYPVTGRKAIPERTWSDTVIKNRQIFAADSIEAIAEVFPDHELIASLGCGSVLNIPAVAGGELLGCVNCLDAAGSYGPGHLAAARKLILPGTACFSLARSLSSSGVE